jgi:hypothetical protein
MKIEIQKIAAQCWPDISARGPALLVWPIGPRKPARWHDRRGFVGGQGLARSAGTPWGSDDGCIEKGRAVGFTPKMVGGGGGGGENGPA